MATSDILNLVLAFSILLVAVAITWFLIEIIRIVRGTRKTVEGIEHSVAAVESSVNKLGDRLVDAVSNLGPLITGIVNIASALISKRRTKRSDEDESKPPENPQE